MPLTVAGCVAAVAGLAWMVDGGAAQPFDEWAVRGLRRADDPAVPKGPGWLREAGLDLTALGSVAVLLLVAATAAGYLLARRRLGQAALVAAATVGGMVLNTALKHLIDRPRPDVVPHLREVTTPSFPSGHAAFSASVLLALGILVARSTPGGRGTAAYCVAAAASITLLTGLSRVYLGVHYPTDVAAGWALGAAWALACAGAYDLLPHRAGRAPLAQHRPAAPDGDRSRAERPMGNRTGKEPGSE